MQKRTQKKQSHEKSVQEEKKSVFEKRESLFVDIAKAGIQEFEQFFSLVNRVRPLSAAHRKELPRDISALSRLLTCERSDLHRPYWSSPKYITAYLYYFLPWNILRLWRLLGGLSLSTPAENAIFLDIGSGPATFPLALWYAKPKWRTLPLTIVAQDVSKQALDFGAKLLECVAQEGGYTPWTFEKLSVPIWKTYQEVRKRERADAKQLFCVSAVNMLNEYCLKRPKNAAKHGFFEDEEDESNESALIDRLGEFCSHMAPFFIEKDEHSLKKDANPYFLCIEPGTRFGGRLIMEMRKKVLEMGLDILAPCTHNSDCPLLEHKRLRTWCHFTFSTQGCPESLMALSTQAGLAKQSLSLAPLLAQKKACCNHDMIATRILSSPFFVPHLLGKARYGCCKQGLLLFENAEKIPQGSLCALSPHLLTSQSTEIDAKSGARIVRVNK